jgi:restriction endonuclease S subunit
LSKSKNALPVLKGRMFYQLRSGIRVRDIDSNDGQLAETYAHYQVVEAGDFAMNHMDLLTGWVDLAKQDGVTSPDYRVFALRPNSESNPDYLLRVFQNSYSSRIFYAFGQGASHFGRWRLPTDEFQDFIVPLPPLLEQVKIGTFLDRETAKIDALVNAQRQLVELLKEKCQAVISHAVTNGLDCTVQMKDSGTEWLGDVPAHWRVVALKRLLPKGVSISYGIVQPGDAQDEGVPFVQTSNMSDGDFAIANLQKTTPEIAAMYPRSNLSGGEVILGIRASIGACHLVPDHLKGCNLSRGVARIACDSTVLSEYLVLYLRSSNVARYWSLARQGTTFSEVSIETVRNALVTVPPKDEQEKIVSLVNAQLRQFDSILNNAKRTIDLLTQRRTALVSAAVTGKIDVRADALDLPKLDRSKFRLIIGAHIVEALANKPSPGRTKTHKIIYLTQVHAGIQELDGAYVRQVAGPLDAQLTDEMEGAFKTTGCILVEQPGGRGTQVLYKVHKGGCGLQHQFRAALGSRAEVVDKLIADLADFDLHDVEAIATLYAVWNDFLLDGQAPTDDEIVKEFLANWHPKKKENFRRSELHTWLGWMRRHGLVPLGRRPRTTTGRLLA